MEFQPGDKVNGHIPMTPCRVNGFYVGPWGPRPDLTEIMIEQRDAPLSAAYTSHEKRRNDLLQRSTKLVPMVVADVRPQGEED